MLIQQLVRFAVPHQTTDFSELDGYLGGADHDLPGWCSTTHLDAVS
jgi:hypothetical protein